MSLKNGVLWLAFASLATGIAGCGGSDESDPSSTSATAAASQVPSSQASAPSADTPAEEVAPPDSPSTDSSPAGTAPNSPAESPVSVSPRDGTPLVATASSDIQEVAMAYLELRENQVSWNQKSPGDWVESAKGILTPKGYSTLKKRFGAEGSLGAEWQVAHDQGIATKVSAKKCGLNLASGINTSTHKVLQCAIQDVPVDKEGKPLPVTKIPSMWTYAGVQPVALLEMVKKGGKWYVQADWTGLAS